METRLNFEMKVGKRVYRLFIDCNANSSDVAVLGGIYVNIGCVNAVVDEKMSHRNYKQAFEVSEDGDYHILVRMIKKPWAIHVNTQYEFKDGQRQIITIRGE